MLTILVRSEKSFLYSSRRSSPRSFAEGGGEEVDAFRGAAGEDDFVRTAGVDELAHCFAGGFMQFGGLLGKEMHAAMHVGIDGVVLVGDGVYHATGLLGSGAVIEIDQRLAIDFTGKDGEVGSYVLDVIHNFDTRTTRIKRTNADFYS